MIIIVAQLDREQIRLRRWRYISSSYDRRSRHNFAVTTTLFEPAIKQSVPPCNKLWPPTKQFLCDFVISQRENFPYGLGTCCDSRSDAHRRVAAHASGVHVRRHLVRDVGVHHSALLTLKDNRRTTSPGHFTEEGGSFRPLLSGASDHRPVGRNLRPPPRSCCHQIPTCSDLRPGIPDRGGDVEGECRPIAHQRIQTEAAER